ncbi:hypothetical protein Lsed01_02320 [Demequina sediminis]|uniref:DUF6457 domain-containing protein n=1 Tax=Demequina sediminis TaxID=1930058 RepID=A0ABP9WJ68_9MICO|nr:DUF6457 domain-containing protein [Demequina sediminis]BDZ60633.1 hypothetical protein GCM10025873_04240 [Demequina sediminis]
MTENTLEKWVAALATELDLDIADVDVQALLDVARDAAHSVVRPAAPLATFLVGYAAGRRGAAGDDLTPECDRASALARDWVAE